MPRWRTWGSPTISTTGPTTAITAMKRRDPRAMSRTTWSATRTWTTTAIGARGPDMAMSGSRMWRQGGHLTMTATGPGSIPGDGPGWTTHLGAMLPSTMVDGHRLKVAGA